MSPDNGDRLNTALRAGNAKLQPLPTDCKCFSCTASDVGRVVKWVLLFVLVTSFVAWVLS